VQQLVIADIARPRHQLLRAMRREGAALQHDAAGQLDRIDRDAAVGFSER
jgi:hypothetical protein